MTILCHIPHPKDSMIEEEQIPSPPLRKISLNVLWEEGYSFVHQWNVNRH